MVQMNAADFGLHDLFGNKNLFAIVLDFIPHYQLMAWMQSKDSPLHHFVLQNMSPNVFLCNSKLCTLGACAFEKNEIQCIPRSVLDKIVLLDNTISEILINGSEVCCLFLLQNKAPFVQKTINDIVPNLSTERLELIIKHVPPSLYEAMLTAICTHRLPNYAEQMIQTHGLQRPNMDIVSRWPHEPDMVRYLLATTPYLQTYHQELFLQLSATLQCNSTICAMCQVIHESGKLSNEFRLILLYEMVVRNNFDCAKLLYRKEDDLQCFFPAVDGSYFAPEYEHDNKADDRNDDDTSHLDRDNWIGMDRYTHYFVDDDSDFYVYFTLPFCTRSNYDYGDDTDDNENVSLEQKRTVLEKDFKVRLHCMARHDIMFGYGIIAYIENSESDDPFANMVRMQLQRLATLSQDDSVVLFQKLCDIGEDRWALVVAQDIENSVFAQTITPKSGRLLRKDKLFGLAYDFGRINHDNIVQWIYHCLENQNYELWCFLTANNLVPLENLLLHNKKFIRLLTRCRLSFLTVVWQETREWEQSYDSLLSSALDAHNASVLRFLLRAPFEVSQALLAIKLPRFIKLGLEGVFAKLHSTTLSDDKINYCYFEALEQPRQVVEALWKRFPIQLSTSDRFAIAHRFKSAICTYKSSNEDLTDTCIFAVEKRLVDLEFLIDIYGVRMVSVLAHFNCDVEFNHLSGIRLPGSRRLCGARHWH